MSFPQKYPQHPYIMDQYNLNFKILTFFAIAISMTNFMFNL